MKHIKTMALVIDADTYPIAVACLPDSFVTVPPEDTFGHVLIINELEAISRHMNVRYGMNSTRTEGFVGLTNFWMPVDLFGEEYKFANAGRRSPLFNEVVKAGKLKADGFNPRPSTGFHSRPRIVRAISEYPDIDED